MAFIIDTRATGNTNTNNNGGQPQNPNKAAGCQGAKFSNSFQTDTLFQGDTFGGKYTPNAPAFSCYNNSSSVVLFNNIPFSPGGFACFDEMIDGCYDTEIPYAFVNLPHTGNFIINKTIKTPRP